MRGSSVFEKDSEDGARKTAARSYVQPSHCFRCESNELRAIEYMTFPEPIELRGCCQIYARRPMAELTLELLEPVGRFT